MALTATDLPDPVVPATSRWGMLARSSTTGAPDICLPRAIGSLISGLRKARVSSSSRSTTISRSSLGSSMPSTVRPGMTATRADNADMFLAMSSESPMMRLALIPASGSSS